MLAEHPVCRARFVKARSVAAKCYGLVNLMECLEVPGAYREAALEARRHSAGAKVVVRPTTQDIPYGHGARCPTNSAETSFSARPALTSLGCTAHWVGARDWRANCFGASVNAL